MPGPRAAQAALLCAVLTVLTVVPSGAQQPTNVQVLVLGCGVAGIKAAADLQARGANVTVLEARQRCYGRVDTQQPAGWPIPVELGAQWFHGDEGSNAVYVYAQSIGVPVVSTGDGEDQITFNGSRVVPEATDSRWAALLEEFDPPFVRSFRRTNKARAANMSLASAAAAFVASKKLSSTDARGFLAGVDNVYVQEFGASADKLNLAYFDADEAYTGDDSIAPGGYQSVFKSLLAGLKDVRLGHEVTRITWSATGTGVQVDTTTGTFNARYVISTLPLGVLQAKLGTLFPGSGARGLSAKKAAAIRSLGMGTLNKVIMQFGSAFWADKSEDNQWISRLPTNTSSPNEFFSLAQATKQPVLVAFYAGDAAVATEALSDAAVVAKVMEALRTMFGSAATEPLRYVVTRWTQDPYALGSYSYFKVGAAADARTQLAVPEARGQLLFAGEATRTDYPASVQGAWLSGQKAAADVAKALKLPPAAAASEPPPTASGASAAAAGAAVLAVAGAAVAAAAEGE